MKAFGFCVVAFATILFSPALSLAQTGSPNGNARITLTSGSVLTVELQQGVYSWADVDQAGAKNKRTIKFEDVQEVVLVANATSSRIVEVQELLGDLGSDEYQRREKAELALANPKLSSDFISMIRGFKENADLETQFRIDRILVEINAYSDVEPANFQLDRLTLKDGTTLEGEMAANEFAVDFRGQTVSLPRHTVAKISSISRNELPANVPVQVKTFNQAADFYDAPGQTIIDFQTDAFGNQMADRYDLSETYSSYGLLTRSPEARNKVGSVLYGFKNAPIQLEGRKCAAVVSPIKKFEGIAEFTFCVPGELANTAGVHRFGMLFEEVDHSRDFVVEAFDAYGNMLGNVEATDQKCCFAGFESSVPIAKIRIQKNPYLKLLGLEREIDATYAFDNLVFTTPVAIDVSTYSKNPYVRLRNGDTLVLTTLSTVLTEEFISCASPVQSSKQIKIPITDVDAIVNRQPRIRTKTGTDPTIWMALLDDQSVNLAYVNSDVIAVDDIAKRDIDPARIVCLWPAGSPLRMPETGDFVEGKTLLIYPSCRIQASDFKIGEKAFSWNVDSKKITQKVNLKPADADDAEEPDPDFTPADSKYVYGDSKGHRPTIWLKAPQPLNRKVGRIITLDGRHLLFGGDSGTELTRLMRASVLLTTDDPKSGAQKKKVVRMREIVSIMFPTDN